MTRRRPRYPKEEFARLGKALYERNIRDKVEAAHAGRIVAIDIETGDFEMADDTLTASRNLLHRLPDAQIWCMRIGYAAVHRFGHRSIQEIA